MSTPRTGYIAAKQRRRLQAEIDHAVTVLCAAYARFPGLTIYSASHRGYVRLEWRDWAYGTRRPLSDWISETTEQVAVTTAILAEMQRLRSNTAARRAA